MLLTVLAASWHCTEHWGRLLYQPPCERARSARSKDSIRAISRPPSMVALPLPGEGCGRRSVNRDFHFSR